MDIPNWAFLGAASTAVMAGWSTIRSLGGWLRGLLIQKVELNWLIHMQVRHYCSTQGKKFSSGSMRFESCEMHVRPLRHMLNVMYEEANALGTFYWLGGCRWCLIRETIQNSANSSSPSGESSGSKYTIMVPRWISDVDDLLIKSAQHFRRTQGRYSRPGSRYYVTKVYGRRDRDNKNREARLTKDGPSGSVGHGNLIASRVLEWRIEDLGPEIIKDPISSLALSDETLKVVESARRWRSSEQWCRDHGVPWKLGILMYGSPGNGKTALTRAMAQSFDFPVYAFDLSSLSNEEFQEAWSSMLTNAPCMAVIEDIDAVFNKRENVTKEKLLTFDCILNCIDGVEKTDGVLLVITTNKVESIDEAIGIPRRDHGEAPGSSSTRPGRIDRSLEMSAPDAEGRMKIATRILGEWPSLMDQVVSEGEGDSGAQFQDRCAWRALSLYWEEKDKL